MRKIIVLLIFSLICCQKKSKSVAIGTQLPVEAIEVNTSKPSDDTIKCKYSDTCILTNAPVKIISSNLVKNEYSGFRDIHLSFKNVSKKDIQAIKFQWYTENALGEPSNLKSSFYFRGESCGLYTELLKSDRSSNVIYEEFSSDAKRIIGAQPYLVIFSDGTKWYPKDQKYLDAHLIKAYD